MDHKQQFEELRIDAPASRTQLLYENFKTRILSGELAAGSSLPNENEMCQLLNVGRSTLRETYQSLATNGLITRSKAGTVINSREQIIASAPFPIAAELAEFDDIFAFRVMYEAECARCAAERITDAELARLSAIVEASRRITDAEELRGSDLKFHRAIVEFSHNPLLINLFPSVWDSFMSILVKNYDRLTAQSPGTLQDAVDHHGAICEAIRARDPETAKARMQAHLYQVYGKI